MKQFRQPPDAIILTLPVELFKDSEMTTEEFKPVFERFMQNEGAYWNFLLTNLPTQDVQYVYIVFDGHVQYRANLVMYERNKSKSFIDDNSGKVRSFTEKNWVLFAGPIVKPVDPVPMKGFQGFRYSQKIF